MLFVIISFWFDENAAKDVEGLTFACIPPHWLAKTELVSKLQLNNNSPRTLLIAPFVEKDGVVEVVELLEDDIVVDFGKPVSTIEEVETFKKKEKIIK